MKTLGIIGVNIASQNLELLERLTVPVEERADRLFALKTFADLSGLVYLATCNRVEFIFTYRQPNDLTSVRNKILDHFFHGQPGAKFEPNDFFLYHGSEAVTHLFSVAAALDSVMIGEAQILGQVKNALTFAQENNLADSQLERVFQAAFRVAKKVRSDTELGKGNVSVVGLAGSLIREFIKTEGLVAAALFGVGEMTRKMAQYLRDQGITEIYFVNRTGAKTQALVEQFGGQGMSLEDFLRNPLPVRIICTATSSPTPILNDQVMTELLEKVNHQKMLAIDLAIPRDIEVTDAITEYVQIFNMSDIKQLSDSNRRQRFRDVDTAREIISAEIDSFQQHEVEDSLKSLFAESHREAADLAQKCLNDLFSKHLPQLADQDRKRIEYMLNKVVNFTAYRPVQMMAKKIASEGLPDSGNHPQALAHRLITPQGN
jgi:glutamyl-tRNA reductase